jgi:hypothetical protein
MKHLKLAATGTTPQSALSSTAETVVRSSDYSISSLEMALAISGFPPARRNNAWLLALAAPIATAGVREAIRPKFLGDGAKSSAWALLAPALVSLAGAGALLMTKYGGPRFRRRCA